MTRLLLLLLALVFAWAATPESQTPVVSPWLETALRQGRSEQRHLVWVYFRDKGTTSVEQSGSAAAWLSARAQARRSSRAILTRVMQIEDLPVEPGYVDQVTGRVSRLRHRSRWLNAVSVEATASEVRAVAALPFVARLDVVRRYRREPEPMEPLDAASAPPDRDERYRSSEALLDYGTSLDQLAQIGVPELHGRGLTGEGVVIAVFDSGFPNLAHPVFGKLKVIAERDFVAKSESVRASTDPHGTATLSVLGGFHEGELIGPAYGATFILAVTEDGRSETPIEEDNWAVAAEWAESMGADIISSSLGYSDFDLPFTSYTDRDMNGETAVTTIAASMAAARGVLVVNSAGNSGFHPDRNTLVAPGDGKQVLTVGAVDSDGVRAEFSSVGPTADGRIKPDVAALGVSAKLVWPPSRTPYARASGTSFSCPLVAGVAALVLQAHPTYTVEQLLLALRSSGSQSAEPDNLLGWGIVSAPKAVDVEIAPAVEPVRRFGFSR